MRPPSEEGAVHVTAADESAAVAAIERGAVGTSGASDELVLGVEAAPTLATFDAVASTK